MSNCVVHVCGSVAHGSLELPTNIRFALISQTIRTKTLRTQASTEIYILETFRRRAFDSHLLLVMFFAYHVHSNNQTHTQRRQAAQWDLSTAKIASTQGNHRNENDLKCAFAALLPRCTTLKSNIVCY